MVEKNTIKQLLIIFIIIGCITTIGYIILKPITNTTTAENATASTTSIIPFPTLKSNSTSSSTASGSGQITISIGKYNAQLPVFVDDIMSGTVLKDKPLNLNLNEGSHTVKICPGTTCETVAVNINSAIKTTIDFEDQLNKHFPQGSLNVSINYPPSNLTLFIDDVSAGNVSPGKPLNLKVVEGNHTMQICNKDDCITEDINIKPSTLTNVDFGNRFLRNTTRAEIMVSIGGYNAQLPVKVDNVTVGTVAQGKPLTIMVNTGEHAIVVCSGAVCEKEQVDAKFGKRSVVEFGERLQRDAEFTAPTARIVSTAQNGNYLVVGVEFINPNTKEVTITVTISCQYSYINNNDERVGSSAQVKVTRVVKASSRSTETPNIYLSGNAVIASPPGITEMTII
jgi:hypothetical protein